jgi:glycolate oxidase FAD binding subunit
MAAGVPTEVSELAQMVGTAGAERRTLALRAGGSKMCILPIAADAVLDLSKLSGIVDYQPTELVLTARAGTPLDDIEQLLRNYRQMLAFEPPDWRSILATHRHSQTLGGVIACNLSGPRRVAAGAARDHFLGVEGINGRGEVFKSGGKVVKNVTGYDLCKLLAGSWGTLAVMTEVTVKVMPEPESSVSVVWHGLGATEASQCMIAALNSAHEISGAAHLPAAVAPGGRALTIVRLEGTEVSLRVRQQALRRERAGELLERAASETLWKGIRNLAPLAGVAGAVWRLSMPQASVARIVEELSRALSFRWFCDWGGGLIWLCIEPGQPDAACILRGAVQGQGHATLFTASFEDRVGVDTFQPLPGPLAALHDRVKYAFDPAGVFNPAAMNPRM